MLLQCTTIILSLFDKLMFNYYEPNSVIHL